MTAQEQCDEWNAKYPVGTFVKVCELGFEKVFKTDSPAEDRGTAMISLDDGGSMMTDLSNVKPYVPPAAPAPAPKATLDDLIREAMVEGKAGDVGLSWGAGVNGARIIVEVNRLAIKDGRWENWSDRFHGRMRQLFEEARNNLK